ncbi:MAG TPA: oligoendopeptidase F [Tepidisphaeraceae bacterium]|nr:oligoendopeptidase F [Tepidisphaeraceae bacterium]
MAKTKSSPKSRKTAKAVKRTKPVKAKRPIAKASRDRSPKKAARVAAVTKKAPAKREMKPGKLKTLPARAAVPVGDTWNLETLFPNDAAWEAAFEAWSRRLTEYRQYKGRLGESAENLAAVLQLDAELDRAGERLGVYAFLKTAEDQGNSDYQRMKGRYQHAATQQSEEGAYIRPEIMAISGDTIEQYLGSDALKDWRLALERILRYRPHTLSGREEQIIAMQGQMSEAANQVFRQLNDADLKWPAIANEHGERVELGHSSFSAFLHSPDRAVRKNAFHTYYAQYDAHKNTIAAAYNGSVQRDVYYARVRNHPSAREAALFADNVPVAVYDSLIDSVHANLPALYRYYDLRKRKMRLKDGIHQYDTYVPILSDLEKRHTWEQAVDVVIDSLAPLGTEYTRTLREGLSTARWSDRYPNAGKQSGAFSYGTFDAAPFIMMNYQPTVLDHVFTLTHEAGHSMHSWYSSRNQPYQYYSYTIFVAEVASTFNEMLLAEHLMKSAKTDNERAYLINRQLDGIRGTIIRQTMFAEFEKVTHALVEAGEPLTVDLLRKEYRKLLELYFGPEFVIDPELEVECLRIPHFYRAFYVYKYATGLSAAIALSQRVLAGGQQELGDYLGFLKGGSSKWPLDLLRDAGVDMEKPEPVNTALAYFDRLVTELDGLI